MQVQQTLPSLDQLLLQIHTGVRPRLYWGEPNAMRVPIVLCRACHQPRPDDGTRCHTADCDAYQYVQIQIRYDLWKRDPVEALRTWEERLIERIYNGANTSFK
jgi:hypothetical protein